MRRAYRFVVTVYIEGETRNDLPPIEEVAEEIATLIQDREDHDHETCVRPIETEDYPDDQQTPQLPESYRRPSR